MHPPLINDSQALLLPLFVRLLLSSSFPPPILRPQELAQRGERLALYTLSLPPWPLASLYPLPVNNR